MNEESIKKFALQHGFEKLFNAGGHFSICDLRELGDVIGVNVRSHPDYKYLSLLHCKDYKDMNDEELVAVQRSCLACLMPRGIDANVAMNAVLAASQNNTDIDNYFPAIGNQND